MYPPSETEIWRVGMVKAAVKTSRGRFAQKQADYRPVAFGLAVLLHLLTRWGRGRRSGRARALGSGGCC